MITPLIILTLLCAPLLLSYLLGKRTAQDRYRYASYGMAVCFGFFAIGHFVQTAGMAEMLPPWLPMRVTIIYLTGVFELVIAVGLLFARWRKLFGQVAIATFICFFAANVYSALNSVGLGGHQWGPVYLLIRTPLQLILIAWVYYFCVRGEQSAFVARANEF